MRVCFVFRREDNLVYTHVPLKDGRSSDKCILKQFCHVDVLECTHTNLEGIGQSLHVASQCNQEMWFIQPAARATQRTVLQQPFFHKLEYTLK